MSEKMFGYPIKSTLGETVITDRTGDYKNMMMDISVVEIKSGEIKKLYSDTDETAILLIKGDVEIKWANESKHCVRQDSFMDGAYCLHIAKKTEITLVSRDLCEILVQKTENENEFTPRFYEQGNYRDEVFGKGLCEDVAVRRVTTFFDYSNAPYSNMVMGEVMSNQGGWSGYLPHSHEQPEVYYYHFSHKNGFGACFIGEDVFKVVDGSFCAIPGGKMHPQVSAPGYRMYYVWMIRHLPNNPWTSRVLDPKHTWITEKN